MAVYCPLSWDQIEQTVNILWRWLSLEQEWPLAAIFQHGDLEVHTWDTCIDIKQANEDYTKGIKITNYNYM